MATAFKYEVFRAPLTSPADTGTFSVADSSATIDFIFYENGKWVVVYHTT